MLSNHLILCCPLLLLPSIFPSIRVFYSESTLHIRWPKYWRFSFSSSNEYSELIYFRIAWFYLLTVHVLSEISTMTCLSWVALNSMAHSFLELGKPFHQDKAVIHEGVVGYNVNKQKYINLFDYNREGNGTPFQYSYLELSDFTFTFHFHALEKEMATHSSVLAWRISGMGEPGGLPSMGLQRVGHV